MRLRQSIQRGFTLLELVIALSASGVLVAGMFSSIFIALRAADESTTPADATLSGSRVLMKIVMDLQDTTKLVVEDYQDIGVRTPDRDGNYVQEAIRYNWSGNAGDSLYRLSGGGSSVVVVEDVHEFSIEYRSSPTGEKYVNLSLQVSDQAAARVETAFRLSNLE